MDGLRVPLSAAEDCGPSLPLTAASCLRCRRLVLAPAGPAGAWSAWDPTAYTQARVRAILGPYGTGQLFGRAVDGGRPHACPPPASAGRVRAVAAQILARADDRLGQDDLIRSVVTRMTADDVDRVSDVMFRRLFGALPLGGSHG